MEETEAIQMPDMLYDWLIKWYDIDSQFRIIITYSRGGILTRKR